ncbi:methyltransferase domain-containing protein [Leptolyngbya sp. FACHB-17]|uniref:class I SAM-dependent methyltransferase n=1 Tax=unclassified Leptolyngbya TaxID=2650499 RepID=UPI001680CEB3|nr:methyltransferase domain-containing protein [Leptolyngbya sp. FACHB-17]MBD2082177.1 methyltransferase domain-containing protein [Leptolyngbya sp. FACHB-17]
MGTNKRVETIVQQEYDRLAKIYDQRWHSYITNTLTFLKQWAQIGSHEIVLDVACGTGEFERLLLQDHPNQQIVGIDVSTEMLTIAQAKLQPYSTVTFKPGNVTALPLKDECFDTVVCASAFHYFDCPLDALAEMRRVLKPGGKVVILDWCKDFLLCRLCDVVLRIVDPAHKQCYTQKELQDFLSRSQLRIKASTKLRFGAWGLMAATATKD